MAGERGTEPRAPCPVHGHRTHPGTRPDSPRWAPAGLVGGGAAGNSPGPQHWGQAQRRLSSRASVSPPVKWGVSTLQTIGHRPDTPSALTRAHPWLQVHPVHRPQQHAHRPADGRGGRGRDPGGRHGWGRQDRLRRWVSTKGAEVSLGTFLAGRSRTPRREAPSSGQR